MEIDEDLKATIDDFKKSLEGVTGVTEVTGVKSWKEDDFALFIKEHADKFKKDNSPLSYILNSLYSMLNDMCDHAVAEPTKSRSPRGAHEVA
jgi:hypothetical protein